MKKVLSHGNTYRVMTCPKCRAYFSYTDNDKFTIEHKKRFPFEEPIVICEIQCPECNEHITIPVEK